MPVAEEPDALTTAGDHVERRLEASTMALYVSIVLLAALTAWNDSRETSDLTALGLVWGTTLGLTIAHIFAFRVASRLFRGDRDRDDVRIALAQFEGAIAVAALCSIPVMVFPPSSETDAIRLELALILGVAGYLTGRTGEASQLKSLALGALVLLAGLSIAVLKNVLSGH